VEQDINSIMGLPSVIVAAAWKKMIFAEYKGHVLWLWLN
jgi:hypothetical protein